jgi:hypothetical protein
VVIPAATLAQKAIQYSGLVKNMPISLISETFVNSETPIFDSMKACEKVLVCSPSKELKSTVEQSGGKCTLSRVLSTSPIRMLVNGAKGDSCLLTRLHSVELVKGLNMHSVDLLYASVEPWDSVKKGHKVTFKWETLLAPDTYQLTEEPKGFITKIDLLKI